VKTEYIITAITAICIFIMLFNRKVRIIRIFLKQISVFKNNSSNKISILDVFSFIFCPIVLSIIITQYYDFVIKKELAEILTTTFSLIFTLLFAFEAVLVGKKDSTNEIEREVIKETFISIMTSSVLTLGASILSMAILFTDIRLIHEILTVAVLILSFMTIMLLLLIIKRTFNVYMNNDKENKK